MAITPSYFPSDPKKPVENGLSHALRKMNLADAGDEIRTAMVEYVMDEAYEIAKATAPVKTGKMRQSIYKQMTSTPYLIRGKVAIPTSIPYRFAVIFGDKRHNANRFLEKALDRAMEKMELNFHKIVDGAFKKARG